MGVITMTNEQVKIRAILDTMDNPMMTPTRQREHIEEIIKLSDIVGPEYIEEAFVDKIMRLENELISLENEMGVAEEEEEDVDTYLDEIDDLNEIIYNFEDTYSKIEEKLNIED